jgi:hypothetical protein
MKTLLTSAALAAMVASSATAYVGDTQLAGSVVWNGTSPTLDDTCTFSANTAGVMTPATATDGRVTWTTTTSAMVTVKLRKQGSAAFHENIKVEPAIWDSSKSAFVASTDGTAHVHNGNSMTAVGTAGVSPQTAGVPAQTAPTETHDATVDYTASTGSKATLNGTLLSNGNNTVGGNTVAYNLNTNVVNVDSIADINGNLVFEIAGTAVHQDAPSQLLSNETYQVSHIVTCLK